MAHHSPNWPVLDRRDLLRWIGAAGVASVLPIGLTACDPATTAPPLAPDPSMKPLGFAGGTDTDLGVGGWCWFQSPRASFGDGGVLWLGTSVSNTDTNLDGTVQATAFDTRTGAILARRSLAKTREDDHTSPSVLALGGKVQLSWALHQLSDYLDVGDTAVGSGFSPQRIHRPGSIRKPGRGMSYSSAHVVAGQRWILYRGEEFSWNLLTSGDGTSWTSRGLVIAPGRAGDRPYLHAASDGKRLHIVVTDGNPTEYRGTSAYAGTVEADLSIRRSTGSKVGSVGAGAPTPKQLLRLAVGVPGASETADTDMWLSDLHVIDGRPTGVLIRRDPWPVGSLSAGNHRHRYFWIRQRSSGWIVEPLCWAGGELCASQPDYAGLAAQDPSNAQRVVVSTNVHPVTGVPLISLADGKVHFELFEGFRSADGTWDFTALTQDSSLDNIRPVIASGGPHKSLAWLRGTYTSWTSFSTSVLVRNAVQPGDALHALPAPPAGTSQPATPPSTPQSGPVPPADSYEVDPG